MNMKLTTSIITDVGSDGLVDHQMRLFQFPLFDRHK